MNPSHPPLTLCELDDPGIPGLESYSPFCLKVHRALRAARLPYTRRHGAYPGAFRKYNPLGQVPVLLIGDEAVSDSTDILRRIEAMVPGSLSGEGGEAARAEVWLWEEFADACVGGFLVAARWADDRNWPAVKQAYFSPMPAILRAILPGRARARVIAGLIARDIWRAGPGRCWERLDATLDALDARARGLEHGFWVGSALSAADIALFAHLHSMRTDITPSQRDQIGRRAALSTYLDGIQARTAGDAATGAG